MKYSELVSVPILQVDTGEISNLHPFYQLNEEEYDFDYSYEELVRMLYAGATHGKGANVRKLADYKKTLESADRILHFIQAFWEYGEELKRYVLSETGKEVKENWWFKLLKAERAEDLFTDCQLITNSTGDILLTALFLDKKSMKEQRKKNEWKSLGYPKEIIESVLSKVLPDELVSAILKARNYDALSVARDEALDALNNLAKLKKPPVIEYTDEVNPATPTVRIDSSEDSGVVSKDTLTLKEAVEYLGISKSRLYKFNLEDRIPFTRPNKGKVYYKREDLDAYLNGQLGMSDDELEELADNYMVKSKKK